jgi:glycerol transport system ATP-binding protein
MARIELDLAHAYRPNPKQDSDYALLPLKLTFEDGGAYALLGPSGCGKTTLRRHGPLPTQAQPQI